MTMTYFSPLQEAVRRLGGVDILVLNHILPIPLGMFDGSPQNLSLTDAVLDVNFKAYVHLTSHALPHLVAANGSLVVVSSLAGKWHITQIVLSSVFSLLFYVLCQVISETDGLDRQTDG